MKKRNYIKKSMLLLLIIILLISYSINSNNKNLIHNGGYEELINIGIVFTKGRFRR